jgi:hypothetical protein
MNPKEWSVTVTGDFGARSYHLPAWLGALLSYLLKQK